MSLQIDGKGSNNGITPAKIAEQVNKDNGRTDVTAEGEIFPTNMVYGDGTKVYVNLDRTVEKKEVDPNATYSVDIDESQIVPPDLFTYEPLTTGANNTKVASINGLNSMPEKTIKITGIDSTYLWRSEKLQYGINYKTEDFELTNTLIIPAQVEYEGELYKVTDVDLSITRDSEDKGNAQSLPDVEKIVYPNTVERIYFSKNSEAWGADPNGHGNVVKSVILSNNLENIPDKFFWRFRKVGKYNDPR